MAIDLTAMEEVCRSIGRTIGEILNIQFGGKKKVGFALLLFDFGPGSEQNNHITYISNGRREDMIRCLEEFLGNVRKEKGGKDE